MKLLILFLLSMSCRYQDFDARFLLAEKLAEEQKFSEAVNVFKEIYHKKSEDNIGQKALYRAALINWVYINNPREARKDLEKVVEISKENRKFQYEVKTSLSELIYSKIEDYASAIQTYKELIEMEPRNEKAALYQYRIAKSYFYLGDFNNALNEYQNVLKKYPTAPFSASVQFEIANTMYSLGSFEDALKTYQLVEQKYHGTQIGVDSLLGSVQCLESMGKLQEALEVLKRTLPHSGHYRNSVKAQVANLSERINKISKGKD